MAINAFRSQRELLLNPIRHCLPPLANSLFGKTMIPGCVCEKACNQSLSSNEKGVALLDCIQSRLEVKPSDFTNLVSILESEPFLKDLAEKLVKEYCE